MDNSYGTPRFTFEWDTAGTELELWPGQLNWRCLPSVAIWRFPEMGVHLNHPFMDFPLKTNQLLGKPHFWKPPFVSKVLRARTLVELTAEVSSRLRRVKDVMLARQVLMNCVPSPNKSLAPPGCDGGDPWMIHKYLKLSSRIPGKSHTLQGNHMETHMEKPWKLNPWQDLTGTR